VPTHMVNLDALIRRDDFAVNVDPRKNNPVDQADKLKIVELEASSLMYKWLRKPDFQRTTAHWPPEKVAGFVGSFVSGDLIPALILWQSDTSGIFVIDGAHRLSALIAWVHDDYGDGQTISLPFFEGNLPPEQKKAAKDTRDIIAVKVGTYAELKHATNLSPEKARFASNLAAGGVTLQWVKGDASRAERSFHTINTEQTPIGELEVRLIRDRRCPNALSARSLVGAGTGRYAPTTFSDEVKEKIKKVSKDIYEDLFVPPLETPIKTLDLPVAGRGYSSETMRLILDFIELVNSRPAEGSDNTKKPRRKRGQKGDILAPTMAIDTDGSATIDFLETTRKASSRIAGVTPGCLGLHPAVYFYSATGNYQPTAFLAATQLIRELEATNDLNTFTQHRKALEELLVKHKYLINQIVRKYGAGTRSLTAVLRLYKYLFHGVRDGKSESDLIPKIVEEDRMDFLKPIVDFDKGTKPDFSTDRKSAVFLKAALEQALRCGECGARIHRASFNIDHVKDKQHGGRASEDNASLTHPYCNSTYKEWRRQQTKSTSA
jgi:hypothetical protein